MTDAQEVRALQRRTARLVDDMAQTIKRAIDLELDRPSLLDSLEHWSFFHRRLTAYARIVEEEARIAARPKDEG